MAEFHRVAANIIINEVRPRLPLGLKIEGEDVAAMAKLKMAGVLTTRDIRRILDQWLKSCS